MFEGDFDLTALHVDAHNPPEPRGPTTPEGTLQHDRSLTRKLTRGDGGDEGAGLVDGALGGTSRLVIGGLATADLRLFADLSQKPALVRAHPFLRGTRVSFAVNNLFNARRTVTDATGATPIRYQQGYLDPVGRAVTISIRKLCLPSPRPRGS